MNTDPRIFFASERTLLAWVRTGIAIIGLGFVVARFGLFLRLLASQGQAPDFAADSTASAMLGVAFVILGSASILGAAIEHSRFVGCLCAEELPPRYSRRFAIILSVLVAILGFGLAFYLVKT